jgi:hypothetical protein
MQALPNKGKEYADLTTTQSLTQKRYYKNQMAPIYMKVSNTGLERFAALPPSVGLFETTAGGADPLSLYAAYPLPTLPEKAIRPGDTWQTSFLEGELDLSKYPNIDSVTKKLPAVGSFLGVEWERGHPCAKIRKEIEVEDVERADPTQTAPQVDAGGNKIAKDKISMVETIWFALDSKKILKVVRDTTIDRKGQMQMGGGMGGSMGPGRGGPSGGPAGVGKGGGGGTTSGDWSGEVPLRQRPGGAPQGPGRPGGPGMQGGPGMGMPGGQGGGFGAGQSVATFIRVRIMQTFTLEM